MKCSALESALLLTNKIFNEINHAHYTAYGYQYLWSAYAPIHQKYSIPFVLGVNQSHSASRNLSTIRRARARILLFVKDVFFFLFSLISLLIAATTKRSNLSLIGTNDVYSPKTLGDFRYGKLYASLHSSNINYLELVSDISYSYSFSNLLKRRRLCIYINSIFRLTQSNRYSRQLHNQLSKEKNADVWTSFISYLPTRRQINIYRLIILLLDPNNIVAWEYSHRSSALIIASKSLNKKVLGIMHGLALNNYMVHEFITPFTDISKKLGPDIMGVWSVWLLEYYLKHSAIYNKLEVSGPLRKPVFATISFSETTTFKHPRPYSFLLIGEPLADYHEIVPYLHFISELGHSINFKSRPNIDSLEYASFALKSGLVDKVVDDDMETAFLAHDIILGTHSTAVIEAALFSRNFLLLCSSKWGNYFNVTSDFFVPSPGRIQSALDLLPSQNLDLVRERYFGSVNSLSGHDWLVNKLKSPI